MPYTPDPFDSAEPQESQSVESAALEFRTLKPVLKRTLRFPAADLEAYTGELPAAASRAGKFLAFDSVTAQPVAGPLLSAWTITQAQIAAIETVATDIAAVNTVATNLIDIQTANANIVSIDTVATNIAAVLTVAADIANVSAVAADLANIDAVAAEIPNLATKVSKTADTGSAIMPAGTTAQRDGVPAFGYVRANSTLTQIEWWNGGSWQAISGVDLTAVATDIIPDSDSTRSLGSSAKAFADIFAGSIRTPGGTASVPTGTVVNGSAKAWVNFNGTGTVAIRAAFNVSSITDNGTGDYTVNFTTAMPDADYCACFTAGSFSGTTGNRATSTNSNAVGSVRCVVTVGTTSAFVDADNCSVAIFR